MVFFISAQDFFVSNSQSKKFKLIKNPMSPEPFVSCAKACRLREAKRAMGRRMVKMLIIDLCFILVSKKEVPETPS